MTTTYPTRAKQHTVYKLTDGTRVPGVTTVLGILAKPQLVKWANNLGLQGIDSSTYVDELSRVGTLAHALIVADLLGTTPDTRDFTPAQQDQAAESIKSWLAWRAKRSIEVIACESPLVSERHRYGGTLDLFAYIDGVATIADLKTAKAIYPEHKTQVTAYRMLAAENINSGLAWPYPQAVKIIRVGREEGEGFEECTVDGLDTRWNFFLACLEVYNLQKALKN